MLFSSCSQTCFMTVSFFGGDKCFALVMYWTNRRGRERARVFTVKLFARAPFFSFSLLSLFLVSLIFSFILYFFIHTFVRWILFYCDSFSSLLPFFLLGLYSPLQPLLLLFGVARRGRRHHRSTDSKTFQGYNECCEERERGKGNIAKHNNLCTTLHVLKTPLFLKKSVFKTESLAKLKGREREGERERERNWFLGVDFFLLLISFFEIFLFSTVFLSFSFSLALSSLILKKGETLFQNATTTTGAASFVIDGMFF